MLDYILLEKYAKDIKVLFVEDDEAIRKEVKELLLNIFPSVDTSPDGRDAYEKYINYYKNNQKNYELIITDIKMPNLDGVSLSEKIFEHNEEQELIVLSAHNDSKYLLRLINLGISQFISKPIEIEKFISVIYIICERIFLKQNQGKEKESVLITLSTKLVWNKVTKKLYEDETAIKLTKKELLLIELLIKEGKTYTIEEIIKILWYDDDETTPDSKNLKNIISRLRKKIPDLLIENVYGFGYRLNLYT